MDPTGRSWEEWAAIAATEIVGGGPEDPVADAAAATEYGAAEAGATAEAADAAEAGTRATAETSGTEAEATQLEKNVANGKMAEEKVANDLGDKVAGRQVTFKTSDGTTTRTDIVTHESGGKDAVEVKYGNGRLTTGQQKLFEDVKAGREVTPVGRNAAQAGFEPGKPIKRNSCTLVRMSGGC